MKIFARRKEHCVSRKRPRICKIFKHIYTADMTRPSHMLGLIALLMVRKCVGSPVDHIGVVGDDSGNDNGVMMDHHINQMVVVKGDFVYQVGEVVSQVVEQELAGCHLVLVDTTIQSPVFSMMIRQFGRTRESVTVVEAWRLFLLTQVVSNESVNDWHNGDRRFKDQLARDQLLHGLWGDATLTCRALIIHFDNNNKDLFFMFLEWCEVWRRPEIPVVVVGEREGVETVLLHHSLRNTIHTLYLALHDLPLHRGQRLSLNTRSRENDIIRAGSQETVARNLRRNQQ
ncbi:uncharacterized protein LOC121873906 [Homarus americanus]|uniref:uncharacterized protein LOC121873906 n=1 Tax=Homarus americanus TaxID=6706 RepID=UPI001C48BB7B|nr:uncharacterized protein LOC121873906 [Homarus americanus]